MPDPATPDVLPTEPSELEACGLRLRSSLVMGGAAVWPAAICLATRLRDMDLCGASLLELGAGAGAPGLVAATLGARPVFLTDGDADILQLMRDNVRLNAPLPAFSDGDGGHGAPLCGSSSRPRDGARHEPPVAVVDPSAVHCCCLDWRDMRQVTHINLLARGSDGSLHLRAAEEAVPPLGFGSGGGRSAAQYIFPVLRSRLVDGDEGRLEECEGQFDLVIAADVLFGVGDIGPLVRATAGLLRRPRCSTAAEAKCGKIHGITCDGHEAAVATARSCDDRIPRVLIARSNFFEAFVPTLCASFEEAGLQLVATHDSPDGEAAVHEFRWSS